MKQTFSYRSASALACALLVATTTFPKPTPKKHTKQSKKLRKRRQAPQQPQTRGTINKFLHLASAGGTAIAAVKIFQTVYTVKKTKPGAKEFYALTGGLCLLATYFLLKDAFFEKQPVKQRKKRTKKKPVTEQANEATIDTEIVVEVTEPYEINFTTESEKLENTEGTEYNTEEDPDFDTPEVKKEAQEDEEENNPELEITVDVSANPEEDIKEDAFEYFDEPRYKEDTQDECVPKEDLLKAVTTAFLQELTVITDTTEEEGVAESFVNEVTTEDVYETGIASECIETAEVEVSFEPGNNTQEEVTAPVEQLKSPEIEIDTVSEIVDEYVEIEQAMNNLNEQFDAMVQDAQNVLETDEDQTSILNA